MPSMPSSSDDAPRFGTDAAQAIFRRAAEHQEMAQAAVRADADGLTLAELQAIGTEAGIDPAYVAAAAAEFSTPEPTDDAPWWYAGPATIEAEGVMPGTITDGPVWAAIVRELRNAFDADGIATQLDNTLEWSFNRAQGTESTRVTATPEQHGTRIRITQSMRELAQVGPMMGGGFGLVGLAIGATLALGGGQPDVVGPMVVFMALSVLFLGAGIPLFRAYARRQQHRLDAIMDRLELTALKAMPSSNRATTPPAAIPSVASEKADRLDDTLLDAEPSDRSRTAPRNRNQAPSP